MIEEQRPNGSGRGPGRRPRLTATGVVDAAIELADTQGLDGLSMPKLARHLGVGTMTVYGYVDSKQDLLDQMAARIFEGLTAPDDDDWHEGLARFLADFRRAALSHPALAALLATGRVTIPAVFTILEQHLESAVAQGATIEEAVRLFYAGLSYTIGFVLWEIPRTHLQPEADYHHQWSNLLSGLDPASHPLLTGPARTVLPSVASDDQFDWGLRRILTA